MIKVFFDINAGENNIGRIVIQLADETPNTSRNFEELCKG
jgi:cyclophilin family peptidyl-prolyl cis-trans isomerase